MNLRFPPQQPQHLLRCTTGVHKHNKSRFMVTLCTDKRPRQSPDAEEEVTKNNKSAQIDVIFLCI